MKAQIAALALAALALGACSPQLPTGVKKEALDDAISRAIGDPATCLFLGRLSDGKRIYRYNTATECDRALPACDSQSTRKLKNLLDETIAEKEPHQASCASTPDGLRTVGWASGVLPKTGLAYAAVMEGKRALPGIVMQDRLADAFKSANLQ